MTEHELRKEMRKVFEWRYEIAKKLSCYMMPSRVLKNLEMYLDLQTARKIAELYGIKETDGEKPFENIKESPERPCSSKE